ncbi:MAG: YqjK family protein [Steroidobacteraceae bacterium]
MSRVEELRERRESLIARSAGLRRQLVEYGNDLEDSLTRVDRGIRTVRSLSAKPLVLAAGGALLFALGPRRAMAWISRGLFFTSIAKRAYGLIAARRNHRRDEDSHSQLFI